MKNIVLICVAGMSTSLLVSHMRVAAKADNYECVINAYPIANAPAVIPEADIILLGPQVKYMSNKLKTEYPDKIIEAIDMRVYGMIDGKGALAQARRIMGD
ncbi:PTS sugar transporter subunit IIB [Anaerocolumna sp. MB42-C2]|uniref:PTS sugar transporter subunit IIB n=1 Tax=Anaerocolumna sp. MB42-C2 TaxID=3070997 RepID=UPI0027E12A31|nr:PTS sugar transporter subunit IIB [Anaerocolumna sp. MB42-C2]WMJ86415.1 PTS sugar transporter subunit IIB [Anaerocolumna sp. MB42-C2]